MADLTFTLRPAAESDFAGIKRLIHAVHINPMQLDWHRFVIAQDAAGTLLGCGQVKSHADGSVELASIAVWEQYRGQGVAGAIIRHLISRFPRPLHLTCRSRMGPYYEKFGFRSLEVSEMPPYFRRLKSLSLALMVFRPGESMLVMRLD